MTRGPTPVALAIIEQDDRILLVERHHGDFTDHWGFPGGKIETEEHLSEAIERETREETGLEATMDTYLGTVSEHVRLEDSTKHVLIHACSVSVTGDETHDSAAWIDKEAIDDIETVPSLLPILENIREHDYIESVIQQRDSGSTLERFDPR